MIHRIAFRTHAERDGFLDTLRRLFGSTTIPMFNADNGRPCSMRVEAHGERGVEVELGRDFVQAERERHLDVLREVGR